MNAHRIRKVKVKDGEIYIRAEREDPGGKTQRELHCRSREEARPEFYVAFESLAAPSLRLIEAPEAWAARTTVSGLSVSHSEDLGIGAVVTLLVTCPNTRAPLVINTPHLSEMSCDGDDAAPLLPDDMREAVEAVIAEAIAYDGGQRAQGDMFGEAKEAARNLDATLRKHGATGEVVNLDGVVVATLGGRG